MRFEKILTTIDAHAEGGPIRLLTGGVPFIPGLSMAEKRDYVRSHLDHLRTCLLYEPRGHSNMDAAILTSPVTEGAAFGLIFMGPSGYINLCGHGTMGAATIAVETGFVEPIEPETEILIDTPAGPVSVRVAVKNGKTTSATLRGVPSLFYGTEQINVPGIGQVAVDIAYGGGTFAIVEATVLGIPLRADDIIRSRPLLAEIKETANRHVRAQHPELNHIQGIDAVLLSDKPTNPKANVKNINAGVSGNIDRSPCGAGTCARLAVQYFKGKLDLGETFVTESIIGSVFYARAIEEITVGGMKAVVPELTGSAFITGFHQFVIDDKDPFRYGFQL